MSECDRYLELLCELLRSEGYQCTQLRRNIVRLLFSHAHVSVSEIHGLLHAEQRMRSSRPAVYANIKLLCEYGIISGTTRHGTTYYELSRGSDHIHLRCRQCGKIIEFKDARLMAAIRKRCRDYLFRPLQCDVVLEGLCSDCNVNGEW